MLSRQFLKLESMWPRWTYWLAIALLTAFNVAILSATSWAAGLTLQSFTHRAPEVAALNIIALTLLFWPGIGVTLRRLDARQDRAWWGLAVYAFAVFAFMITFYDKPFAIGATPSFVNLLPTILYVILSAWLIVEIVVIGDRKNSNN